MPCIDIAALCAFCDHPAGSEPLLCPTHAAIVLRRACRVCALGGDDTPRMSAPAVGERGAAYWLCVRHYQLRRRGHVR